MTTCQSSQVAQHMLFNPANDHMPITTSCTTHVIQPSKWPHANHHKLHNTCYSTQRCMNNVYLEINVDCLFVTCIRITDEAARVSRKVISWDSENTNTLSHSKLTFQFVKYIRKTPRWAAFLQTGLKLEKKRSCQRVTVGFSKVIVNFNRKKWN